jgi:hypothetical protein
MTNIDYFKTPSNIPGHFHAGRSTVQLIHYPCSGLGKACKYVRAPFTGTVVLQCGRLTLHRCLDTLANTASVGQITTV